MTKISLHAKKQTVACLRWDAWVEENKADFEFYIPKWRVPKPWPAHIFVGVEPFSGDPSNFSQSRWDLDNLDNSIKVLVEPIEDEYHTRTVKYAPFGDKDGWQTGEPYIPFSLIPPDSDFLIIEVKWDLESKDKFVEVPTYREDL